MTDMEDIHKKYIESLLIPEIIGKLKNEQLLSFTAEHSSGIDGFMSTLYNIKLITKTEEEGEKQRLLIAKFMRGDVEFRESSKSYIQFANEIYIYATVLPAFEQMLRECKVDNIKITDWVPLNFKAEFGFIEGLSSKPDQREAVLALENLKPLGYKLGPRLSLNLNHLQSMCRPLAQYHACSYGLKHLNNPEYQRLIDGIIPLPFINDSDPQDAKKNLYRILYRVAFDRFYEFYDRKIDTETFDRNAPKDKLFIEAIEKMREKYFDDPARLMESLRTKVRETERDKRFAVILHGDYNRNNVLFKYKGQEGGDGQQLVEDVKMIDFQELRYGSPVLDLSFFMFFNSTEEIRSTLDWFTIIKTYHKAMLETLSTILEGSDKSKEEIKEILNLYSLDDFCAHFKRFAFYGAMICLHFLPWMLCSEEECNRLSELFASDMRGEEFHKLSIDAGGDEVNMRILEILRDACNKHYMDDL